MFGALDPPTFVQGMNACFGSNFKLYSVVSLLFKDANKTTEKPTFLYNVC